MSNAPAEDGPHPFEPRDADEARRDGLSVAGCDYCGQVAADPIHDDEPNGDTNPREPRLCPICQGSHAGPIDHNAINLS